ncbi:MAG: multiheme c-type cytochrome [Kofleriaceae bacterium]
MTRALAIMLLLATSAVAGRADWSGSAACGACHPKELAAWQTTPHASTRNRFPQRPQAQCLGCHGTGEAPAGPAIAVEVGCEACHGAGAAYVEDDVMRDKPVALALGMIDLANPKIRAATCNACHVRRTKSTPFDPMTNPHPVK